MAKKRRLGKGLEALIPQEIFEDELEEKKDDSKVRKDLEKEELKEKPKEELKEEPKEELKEEIKEEKVLEKIDESKIYDIEMSKIRARDDQPRKEFDEKKLEDLAESIELYGVIQPIILAKKDDTYEIIAGERRFRASKIAGFKTIPAIIKDIDYVEVEILSLIENVQREDLNPYEEALAYFRFKDEYEMSQEEISKRVGKSRSYIANMQRLLNLDEKTLDELKEGNITSTQGRTLLAIDDLTERGKYRELLINKEINIKDIEGVFKNKRNRKRQTKVKTKDIYIKDMEDKFRETLGTKVTINKKGNIWNTNIELYSEEDIEALLRRLEDDI